MKKILLLGYTSKIAKTFIENYKLDFIFHGFGRRRELLDIDRVIIGTWNTLSNNKEIDSDYDFIINLIFLREESVENNLLFTEEIVRLFSKQKSSCRLIHISSTMVHGYEKKLISKSFPPLPSRKLLGYALVKGRTEEYLDRYIGKLQIVRFGYVSDNNEFLCFRRSPNIRLFKGTKSRVIPITYWNTVLKTIFDCINQPVSKRIRVVVDEQCNYNSVSRNSKRITLYIPRFMLTLVLCFLYLLRLERQSFRVKTLDMKVIYKD
jgi:hypothetical protein